MESVNDKWIFFGYLGWNHYLVQGPELNGNEGHLTFGTGPVTCKRGEQKERRRD